MPEPSEEFYETLSAEPENENRYFDRYDIDEDDGNPLAHVTPNPTDDFFGPKVINIVCLTGPFVDWDWDGVEECVARLQEVYEDFIGYETHFIIDEMAEDWDNASESAKDETIEEFESLINDYDANSIGIFFWGPLQGDALQNKIRELLDTFYT
jgi:hypothetical protein